MDEQEVITLAVKMISVTAKVAAPLLIASMAVGLGISIMQSVTQIQEFTLTFVPKVIAMVLVMVLTGSWMLNELTEFTESLFADIPQYVRNG